MPAIHLDFSNIEDFDPLPPGVYPVIIESLQVRDSTEKPGNQYLNWVLSVSEGDYEGRKVFMTNGLTEKSLYYLHEQFLNLEVIEDDAAEMDLEVDEETGYVLEPDVTGIAALAEVSQRVNKGKLVNQVDYLGLEEPGAELPFVPDKKPSKPAGKPATKPVTKKNGSKFR